MLFNGFELQFETNSIDGDPFRDSNNINNVSCPGNCPANAAVMSEQIWEIEKAYIRKVIDTVNDLDNVLYEVANEIASPSSDSWQLRVIKYVKDYEVSKPKHHPVGMTAQAPGGSDLTLYNSPADWISPNSHVPPSDGKKVIINDTDHSYGSGELKQDGAMGQRAWVWENFTSGNNVAFMDPYLVGWTGRNAPDGTTADPHIGVKPDNFYEPIRTAMGMTLTYSNRMNLNAATPQPASCSTHFCLVNRGSEYLVYQPYAGNFSLRLAAGTYLYEWLDPSTNLITDSGTVSVADGDHTFISPFAGDAVLYLKAH
jgi:hypothetical protein